MLTKLKFSWSWQPQLSYFCHWPGWPWCFMPGQSGLWPGSTRFQARLWPRSATARPGRAGRLTTASPVFLSLGQPGQSLACGRAHLGFQARLWPRSTPVWPGSWCKGSPQLVKSLAMEGCPSLWQNGCLSSKDVFFALKALNSIV